MYESQGESTAVISWQTEKGWRHCLEYYLPEQQQGEWLCLRPHFCLRPSLVQAASLQWYLEVFMQFISNLSLPPCLPQGLQVPIFSESTPNTGIFRFKALLVDRFRMIIGRLWKNQKLVTATQELRNDTQLQSHLPLATSRPSPCKCPNGLKLWATSAVGLICFVNHLQSCCILKNSSFQHWRAQPVFLQGSQGAWEAA